MMSMVSSHRAQFLLVKNPETMTDASTAAVTTFTSSGTLSAIEYNSPDSPSNAIAAFTGGLQLAAFYTGDADASTVDLSRIFSTPVSTSPVRQQLRALLETSCLSQHAHWTTTPTPVKQA